MGSSPQGGGGDDPGGPWDGFVFALLVVAMPVAYLLAEVIPHS